MDQNETIGTTTKQAGVEGKMTVFDPVIIEIFKSDELRAAPEIAEVFRNGRIGFKAVGVDVTVFLPHQKLVPVDTELGSANEGLPDPLKFDLEAGKTEMFTAVDEVTLVAYWVVRKVFDGYTEALSRPPVIIIKQVDK